MYDIRECNYFNATKVKFLERIKKTDACWLWTAGTTRTKRHGYGYGKFYISGKRYVAHRMSYMLFNGPIPWDKLVRHTCDNKLCVNPDHLILGTKADNSEDAVKRGRVGCQKLNPEAVKVIKWMLKYKPKKGLAVKLAELYKVHPNTIYDIKNKHTWPWLIV